MTPFLRTAVVTLALLVCAVSAHSQSRYTFSASGDEVTDTQTGLIWRRCSEGQTWNGSTCTGSATTYTLERALAHAKAQAGTAGWRLPNVKELGSISDVTSSSDPTDKNVFPANRMNGVHWSSTPLAGNPAGWGIHGAVWGVNLSLGSASHSQGHGASQSFSVRLVR